MVLWHEKSDRGYAAHCLRVPPYFEKPLAAEQGKSPGLSVEGDQGNCTASSSASPPIFSLQMMKQADRSSIMTSMRAGQREKEGAGTGPASEKTRSWGVDISDTIIMASDHVQPASTARKQRNSWDQDKPSKGN